PVFSQTPGTGLTGTTTAAPSQPSEKGSEDGGGDGSYAPSTTSSSNQNPFLSSVTAAKPEPAVLQLSFKAPMQRAALNNLERLLASDSARRASGQKRQELSYLLHNVSVAGTQAAAQIDLAALGFRFNFPGISPVIGPIGTFDARGYVTTPLFDWHYFQRERGA